MINELGDIVLGYSENGNKTCMTIDNFAKFFGEIINDDSIEDKHSALINDNRAFKSFFDYWKEKGILN